MMNALAHGLLGWLALALAFGLGWAFCALCGASQRRESIISDAERIGAWQRENEKNLPGSAGQDGRCAAASGSGRRWGLRGSGVLD